MMACADLRCGGRGVLVGMEDGGGRGEASSLLFLEGVVSGAISSSDCSDRSVMVERDDGTAGSLTDLIRCFGVGRRRTGVFSGSSTRVRFGAGAAAAASSSAGRLRSPGMNPLRPATTLFHGDATGVAAGTTSSAPARRDGSTAVAGVSWAAWCGGDWAAATGPAEAATGVVAAATGMVVLFSWE